MRKIIVACLFFSSVCYSAEKLTEKQIEDFKANCVELYLTDSSQKT